MDASMIRIVCAIFAAALLGLIVLRWENQSVEEE